MKNIWKKIRLVVISVWASALTLIILSKNPDILPFHPVHEIDEFRPEFKAPFFLQTSSMDSLSEPLFIYRENISRTGQSILQTSLKVKETWRGPQINYDIHGASKSSPTLDKSGIYIGADTGWIYAYNHDGTLRWSFLAGNAAQGVHGSGATDDKYLYIGAYNGRLYCFDKMTGELIWMTSLAHAIGDVPVLYGDYLYVAVEYSGPRNGQLVKIDRRTGQSVWVSDSFAEQVHSSPTLDPKNNLVFVGNNGSEVLAFDMNTGMSVWTFSTPGPIKGTMALHEGRLYLTSWGARAFCLDALTGSVIWEHKLMSDSQSSPTLVPEDNIMVFNSHRAENHMYGLNMKTGQEIWKKPQKNTGLIGSGVALKRNDNRQWVIWIQCFEKTICAIEPKTGKALKQLSLPGELNGVPAFDEKGFVVSLHKGGLVRFDYF